MAAQGFRQVTLLGQNVNSYAAAGRTFADLILDVAEVSGIERVRFTSPHPKDFPEPLLDAIAAHPKICKHIHLPMQSGSDRILALMNRTYTQVEFLHLVEKMRKIIPEIALSTDMIVGFPTETEADHLKTMAALEASQFDSAYIFKYSERKGTIAARKFPDDVLPEIKTRRIVALFESQHAISLAKNRAKIGHEMTVLIEGKADKRPGYQVGKSDGHQTVLFPQTSYGPGKLIPVEITDATTSTLRGDAITVPKSAIPMFTSS